jgi:hypothetical protein
MPAPSSGPPSATLTTVPGASTARLVAIVSIVVGVAIGSVVVLVPQGRTATLSDRRALGPGVPPPAAPGHAQWIVDENARPGTSDWQLSGPVSHGEIEGYADTTSTTRGQTVRLFVSTSAPTYRVEAYRMGWYGGRQARLVWRSGLVRGARQAERSVDPVTNMVETRWGPSLSVRVDQAWPPGAYLLKLAADNGYAQYVPLTVRDDTGRSALLVVDAVTTWQAYNRWGGHSLYDGVNRHGATTAEARSQVVSFDRPYENDSGAGDFLGNELPMVSLLERSGYDVSYWTDVDLHQRPELLDRHRAVVTLGHDEYWSLEMRTAVERARDSGVNVAFFGANAVFRSIRLAPSGLGPARREVNYRSAQSDPLHGIDDTRVTVSWRDPPLNRPESTLIGAFYQCNPVKADMVVADGSAWVFAGTNLAGGDRLADLVGPEYDRYDVNAPGPPGPVQVLAHSPVRCGGRASFSDMTYYTAPAGAGVFATGTNWWVSRVNPACAPADGCSDARVATITRNVLDAFAAGPAGLAHPSVSNLHRLPDNRSRDTTPADATENQSRVTAASTTTTVAQRPRPPTSGPPTTRRALPPTTISIRPSLPFPRPPASP